MSITKQKEKFILSKVIRVTSIQRFVIYFEIPTENRIILNKNNF